MQPQLFSWKYASRHELICVHVFEQLHVYLEVVGVGRVTGATFLSLTGMYLAVVHAEDETIDPPKTASATKSPKGRGLLSKHLPRVEEVIAPGSTTCGCGTERHFIGEDVSERLDIVPAQFRVIVTRRPKYACRDCEVGIVQAPAKPRLIEGGMPTEATVASVIVSKYADHLPLYRQSQIYARQGVNID